MLGNLQVRFGVGAGVQFPGPHHAAKDFSELQEVSPPERHLSNLAFTETCRGWSTSARKAKAKLWSVDLTAAVFEPAERTLDEVSQSYRKRAGSSAERPMFNVP